MIDILLCPFLVGTHVVGPLQEWSPWDHPHSFSQWALEKPPVGLGNGTFWGWVGRPAGGTCMAYPRQLGWKYLWPSLCVSPIFCTKTTILDSKPPFFPWKFCDFIENSLISFEILGNSKMDPGQNGCEVDFGRRGNTPCHRIDELFKPNWPPRAPQSPRRPPRRPPQGFWK